MTRYIDEHRDEFGVEPICEQLPIAPSIYYARQVSSGLGREQSDEELRVEIRLVHYLWLLVAISTRSTGSSLASPVIRISVVVRRGNRVKPM
jgi:hypothetical protein